MLFPLASRAQEDTAATFTLEAALARAGEHSPKLAAWPHRWQAADALTTQAGLPPNPTLDVELENFAGTGDTQGVRRLETTLQASQLIERGDKRTKRVALAHRDREAAVLEYAVERSAVLAATASAFVEAFAARQNLALASESAALARETLAAVQVRVEAAVASPAETARARAALAFAEAERGRSAVRLTAAQSALAAAWDGSAAEIPPLAGSLHLPATLPAAAIWLGRLPLHPRLELQRALISSRRAALELEHAQAVPDITIGGGLRFLREDSSAALVAGVSVPLPLRNRNQGKVRAARETLAGAEVEARAVAAELRREFDVAWHDLASAHGTAQSLRREVLPATADAHRIVKDAYQQGLVPLTEVLDAQRALAAVRRELLEAETRFGTALVRIEALADQGFTATGQLFSLP